MPPRQYSCSMRIERPLEEVFQLFSVPHNLEAITPAWLRFQIVPPEPGDLCEGARIHYRLRLRGIPLRWTSVISAWEPPHRFVDTQLRGPFRTWIHEHTFRRDGDATIVDDHVTYAAPLGFLVERWLVKPDVERIFRFREQSLRSLLMPAKAAAPAL